jgi:hypothetical protein
VDPFDPVIAHTPPPSATPVRTTKELSTNAKKVTVSVLYWYTSFPALTRATISEHSKFFRKEELFFFFGPKDQKKKKSENRSKTEKTRGNRCETHVRTHPNRFLAKKKKNFFLTRTRPKTCVGHFFASKDPSTTGFGPIVEKKNFWGRRVWVGVGSRADPLIRLFTLITLKKQFPQLPE